MNDKKQSHVSIIMPAYNQGAFISRAISSLLLQTFSGWELIIVNDGSSDYTDEVVAGYLDNKNIRYVEHACNMGLGESLNRGLREARYDTIGYLPCDDIYFSDHLEKLVRKLGEDEANVLAYSGAVYNRHDDPGGSFYDSWTGKISGYWQLVQVLHKRTGVLWTESDELVTDDLDRMLWNRLLLSGKACSTGEITCEWVSHPLQRHKQIRENLGGGLNVYRKLYRLDRPVIFQSSVGNYLNEIEYYKDFRAQQPLARDGLKILLVGELAYNAERIYALEEAGHRLYGIWTESPAFFNTIGPLPFGHVEDIPLTGWKQRVEEIKPDIIYALLNFAAVPVAHHILMNNPGIPFVWHFKEGPTYCRQFGIWSELMELFANSDGQIYINQESKDWFSQFLSVETPYFIMDGDLPSRRWQSGARRTLLSEMDGEVHTVVPGRPMGIGLEEVQQLIGQKIHIHLYGTSYKAVWGQRGGLAVELTESGYVHFHPQCPAPDWVSELSQYDAGWLHCFDSQNNGELMKASWDDLNYPARMSTLGTVGIPMLQKQNAGHRVASREMTKRWGVGIYFDDFNELGPIFRDRDFIGTIRSNAYMNRDIFSFDHYVGDLVSFFKLVIARSMTRPHHLQRKSILYADKAI